MNASWSDGYVADSEYVPGFYKEQVPNHLDLACLLSGFEPPRRAPGWTYCDLGCGQGATLLVLAAANPDGLFIGVDFNPAHIARAQSVAESAGLSNIVFHEASFEELAANPSTLPPLDYVTAHGVYSWIGERSRHAFVELLRARLKPGGAAYISYNAQPGWNRIAPLQRLLLDQARLSGKPSSQAVVDGVAFLRSLETAGAPCLAAPDVLERLEHEITRGNITYLAHEYLNANWQPRYHADVAKEVAEAKLSYAASANLLENFPELSLLPPQHAVLEAALPAARETLRDYFMPRSFRRDIFLRGPRRLSHDEREARIGRLPLLLLRALHHTSRKVEVPVGQIELDVLPYEGIFQHLADGPARIADLLAASGAVGTSAVEVAGMLVGSGQAEIYEHQSSESARAFNLIALNEMPLASAGVTPVAAPAIGGGVHFRLFDRLVLSALLAGVAAEAEAVSAHAWGALCKRGVRLTQAGRDVTTDSDNMEILRRETAEVLSDGLPVWRRLGLV